jgi:hypothetical protein
LEVVALVSGVESEDVLLFEYLKVMEYDDHAHADIFFPIIEEKHIIDLDVFDGVAKGGRILGLTLKLLSRLNPTNHPNYVNDCQVLLL